VLAACGGDGDSAAALPDPVLSDSAGVVVVTHPAGILTDPDGPAAPFAPDFAEGPALSIGVEEGDAAFQFTSPVGAARLADGTIVVLDRQSRELRFFGDGGRHLRTRGGQGDGPGEFRNPSALHHLEGDTLLVIDLQQQRLHWFGPAGDFVRDASVSSLGLDHRMSSATPDGAGGLLLLGAVPLGGDGSLPPSGRIRADVQLLHLARGQDAPALLGSFPGSETELRITSSGGELTSIEVLTLPWMALLLSAPASSGMWTADGVTHELLLRGAEAGSGSSRALVARVVRFSDPPRPFDAAVRDTIERAELEAAASEAVRDALRERHRNLEVPATVPPVADLFGDREGRIWIAPSVLPFRPLPGGLGRDVGRWLVLDQEGMALGWVSFPERGRPLWASDEGLLRVRFDELEIPYIEW
jgi:hypothetical protein